LRFRPTLLPTLMTVPALLVLLGLGAWQLQRLEWKEGLIAERRAGLAAAPIALPRRFDAAELSHRRVRLAGSFRHEYELYLGARVHKGISGTEVLTPLRLDDGRTIMVNRGWVPLTRRDPATRPESLDPGRVEIAGILRPEQLDGGWLGPRNDAAAGHWFFYEVPAMARWLGLDLLPAVVEALPGADPDRLPVGRTPEVTLVSNHLQYAITWFALALVLAVIYVVYHLGRDRKA
jgi:surfeit locus 1 family protein